jgi:hypothetical protein
MKQVSNFEIGIVTLASIIISLIPIRGEEHLLVNETYSIMISLPLPDFKFLLLLMTIKGSISLP